MHELTLAQWIASQLPPMRRYARALTGSQETGDELVTTLLKALIDETTMFASATSRRVGLYRAFSSVWHKERGTRAAKTPPDGEVSARIEQVSPDAREAFLLICMEEFTTDEVAEILGCDRSTVNVLLHAAGEEIARQIATSVLIIEDEPLISMDLSDIAGSLGHSVAGIARTHAEAVRLADSLRPGLVLADVQLADGSSGVAAVNELLRRMTVPVIFITAYPERLLTGERPEPTFLVSKPYRPDLLKAMISQALFFSATARPAIAAA